MSWLILDKNQSKYSTKLSDVFLGDNLFMNMSYCQSRKELLENIYEYCKNDILPAIDNDLNNSVACDKDVVICGMEISEYKSYLRYLEVCIHLQALVQMWEQQIASTFMYSIGREKQIISTQGNSDITSFVNFKGIFILFDIDVTSWTLWQKISDIRHIVNVIKHSMGKSLDTIKNIKPNIIFHEKQSNFDMVTFSYSSLLEENMDICESFDEYVGYLLCFWDEVPQRIEILKN